MYTILYVCTVPHGVFCYSTFLHVNNSKKKISTFIKTDIEKWAIAKNVDYVVLKLFLSHTC